jgi:hypothetical protein
MNRLQLWLLYQSLRCCCCCRPAWADIYPNHLLVKKVDVPLLVLHGTADEVIS